MRPHFGCPVSPVFPISKNDSLCLVALTASTMPWLVQCSPRNTCRPVLRIMMSKSLIRFIFFSCGPYRVPDGKSHEGTALFAVWYECACDIFLVVPALKPQDSPPREAIATCRLLVRLGVEGWRVGLPKKENKSGPKHPLALMTI